MDRPSKRLQEWIVSRRYQIGHCGREVGVAGDPAETREVLRARGDACLLHAPDECRDMARHSGGIVAVLALQPADGCVPCVGARRHDIGHRREIKIDACRAQLAAPSGRHPLEVRRRQCSLAERRGHHVEPGTRKSLNQTAFLIGGDQELHPACSRGRGLGLDGVHDGANGSHAGRSLCRERDRPEMELSNGRPLRGVEMVPG